MIQVPCTLAKTMESFLENERGEKKDQIRPLDSEAYCVPGTSCGLNIWKNNHHDSISVRQFLILGIQLIPEHGFSLAANK